MAEQLGASGSRTAESARTVGWGFWVWWVLASTVGWLIGPNLGTTLVILGVSLAPTLARAGTVFHTIVPLVFPVIILGTFTRAMNREGAIAGMLSGITFTAAYIIYFRFVNPAADSPENWWFGISPEGIGTLGMLLNFAVAFTVSKFTPAPPASINELIDRIRVPGTIATGGRS